MSNRETSPDQLTVAVPVLDGEGRIDLALGMRLVWSPREEARIDAVHDLLVASRAALLDILLTPSPTAVP